VANGGAEDAEGSDDCVWRTAAPHLRQNRAFSIKSAPQLVQNLGMMLDDLETT
jgi:hypothetical protein